MGALVTLELSADAAQLDLPWIITFGPLNDDEDWEPVVCGPYERPHALALAEHIVADEELMAVVEPLLPATSLDEIRQEIGKAQRLALEEIEEIEDIEEYDSADGAVTGYDENELNGESADDHVAPEPPTADEVRAGFARISARLAGS
jgi:hypothetical protein